MFYAVNLSDKNINKSKDAEFLTNAAYIPNWSKFSSNGNITYAPANGVGPDAWAVKVDFSTAPDKENIAAALKKLVGYNNESAATQIDKFKFNVTLASGDVRVFSK